MVRRSPRSRAFSRAKAWRSIAKRSSRLTFFGVQSSGETFWMSESAGKSPMAITAQRGSPERSLVFAARGRSASIPCPIIKTSTPAAVEGECAKAASKLGSVVREAEANISCVAAWAMAAVGASIPIRKQEFTFIELTMLVADVPTIPVCVQLIYPLKPPAMTRTPDIPGIKGRQARFSAWPVGFCSSHRRNPTAPSKSPPL